jgi:hypothetical protein
MGEAQNKCKRCRSYSINPHLHGRTEGEDLDLCDVCYWKKRYDDLKRIIQGGNDESSFGRTEKIMQ